MFKKSTFRMALILSVACDLLSMPSWRMLLISYPLREMFPSMASRLAQMRDDRLCLSMIQGSPMCAIIVSTSFDVSVFTLFV